MGATKRTTEHTCKISPILNNKPRTRCRRPAQSSLIPEVTSNHVQALFQGLVVLECQNISPVDTIHQPQLITSTRNFIERFRNHRASPHSEHTCPGCRGIRQVVSLSSLRLANALQTGDQQSISIFRAVVDRLHEAWEGPIPSSPPRSSSV